MNDLERDLRELLQRKADEGWAEPEAPVRVLRRVRRRQAATAAVGGLAAALVGLASFAGVRAVLDPDGGDTPSAPTATRTLNGITIEYPEGWFLVDPRTVIGDAAQGILLALSNRELTPEAMGCPGEAEGSATDQVMLTVSRAPSGVPGDPWPVSLDALPIEGGTADLRCFPRWEFLNARWTASGRRYEGAVGIGPGVTPADREAIASAFASMAFVAGSPDPTAAVIGEGTAAGEAWQLMVRSAGRYLELELAHPSGGIVMSGPFEGDVPLEAWTPLVLGRGQAAEIVAFGFVSPEVASVRATIPGWGGVAGRVLDIPDEITTDLRAFVATVPAGEQVIVSVSDSEGNVLVEQALDTDEGSTSVPTTPEQHESDPPVTPLGPTHGGTYWGAFLWVGDYGTDGELADQIASWLRERGVSFIEGDLGCDQPIEGSLGEPGDDWRVAVYFDSSADAEAFLGWYFEARYPGGDPAPIPIVEVRTYCLD
jgi:hypothetical protein